MEFKKFKSGMEMYEYVHDGKDLYSKSLGTYIFDYNDAGALCIYSLDEDEIVELINKCLEYDDEGEEYWAGHLGWGGEILDDFDYDDDEHRYSNDWELNKLYLRPSLEFCEETFDVEDWLDTDDVTVEYVLAK